MTELLSQNSYDATPYHSYPFAQSSPENLRTLGLLFGMNPPAIETARILELGCSEGGNLVPLAIKYPKSHCVGVDLSQVQINTGLVHIQGLGLKNIELKHMSLTDIDDSFGKFDYIICHGVISWVPELVQKRIFEISSKNLSENGIAYISYNTLPGWNMVRTIRDMMMYHATGFNTPQEKVSQGRLLLDFVKDSLEGQNTPYANVLKQEAELLSKQTDFYLLHEHLEDNNVQFYFSDFMKNAAAEGLQYLSDCSLASMYLGNMPASVVEKLQGLNDIVRTEQYMDFINNRRFRSTLLCHNNIPLNRNLNNESVKQFSMTLNITPERPLADGDFKSSENIKFFFQGDPVNNIASTSPALKAALTVFSENVNTPLNFDAVVKLADEKMGGGKKADIEKDLIANVMTLVVKGYVTLYSLPGEPAKVSFDKPKVSKLASYQAETSPNSWVTNNLHTPVAINIFEKFAIKYMDGKNGKDQILTHLLEEVKSGKLTVSKENKKVEDEKEIKVELSKFLDESIKRLSTQGLFI